jgi:glycosyltransferase involved in cell wall biosynthesis
MSKPYFSIVIPTLNEEKYLPYLLDDLTNQTFSDFEVIIVDGHSEDKTVQKAMTYTKRLNIRVIESKKRNVCHQRNLGAKNSLGDWIIFFDADNRLPNYFLQGIKFYTEMLPTNLITTHIKPDTQNKKDMALAKITNLSFEIGKNSAHPSVLESMIAVKKDVFLKIGGFNEKIHWGEGTDLLSRMRKKGLRFDFLKEPKYTYSLRRLRKQSVFSVLRNIAEHEIARMARIHLPKEYQKKLYPLEGGKFYEVDSKSRMKIEDLFRKILELDRPPRNRANQKNKDLTVRKIISSILKKGAS